MSKFTKKISGLFNKVDKKKNEALSSEAFPTVGAGSVIGSVATGGGIIGGMMLAGVATIPLGIGFPIIAAGIVGGGLTGKYYHNKKQQKNKPKPGK